MTDLSNTYYITGSRPLLDSIQQRLTATGIDSHWLLQTDERCSLCVDGVWREESVQMIEIALQKLIGLHPSIDVYMEQFNCIDEPELSIIRLTQPNEILLRHVFAFPCSPEQALADGFSPEEVLAEAEEWRAYAEARFRLVGRP